MHHLRTRFALVISLAMLMCALSISSTGMVEASPALSSGTPPPRQIGQQAHGQSGSASTAEAPADTYFGYIFDKASQSGSTFYLQSEVDCEVTATIQQDDAMQI